MSKRHCTGQIIPSGTHHEWDMLTNEDKDRVLMEFLTPLAKHLIHSLVALVWQYYANSYDTIKLEVRDFFNGKPRDLLNPKLAHSVKVSADGFMTFLVYAAPMYLFTFPALQLCITKRVHDFDYKQSWSHAVLQYKEQEYDEYIPMHPACNMEEFIKVFSYTPNVIVLFRTKICVFQERKLVKTIPLPPCFLCNDSSCTSQVFYDCVPFYENVIVVFECQNQFVIKHLLL